MDVINRQSKIVIMTSEINLSTYRTVIKSRGNQFYSIRDVAYMAFNIKQRWRVHTYCISR